MIAIGRPGRVNIAAGVGGDMLYLRRTGREPAGTVHSQRINIVVAAPIRDEGDLRPIRRPNGLPFVLWRMGQIEGDAAREVEQVNILVAVAGGGVGELAAVREQRAYADS